MGKNEFINVNAFFLYLKSPWSFSYSSSQVTKTSKHWLITFSNSSKAICISRRVPNTCTTGKENYYLNSLLILMTAINHCNVNYLKKKIYIYIAGDKALFFTVNQTSNIIQHFHMWWHTQKKFILRINYARNTSQNTIPINILTKLKSM